MPTLLKYVAQTAMDEYFQNYRGETDFWDLDDFIFNCGYVVASLYQDVYKQQYNENRQEKKDELISFDTGMLSTQVADVEKDGTDLVATLSYPVMVFAYDKNSCGIQSVFDAKSGDEFERITDGSVWQFKYMPKTDRIFFYASATNSDCTAITQIKFLNKGKCNSKQVKVLYVPSMNENAIIPDGLINDTITKTVMQMRQMAQNKIVGKTDDFNPNKIIQTEIDKNALT